MGAVEVQPLLTGGCQSGAGRYRLEEAPTGQNVCHCRVRSLDRDTSIAPEMQYEVESRLQWLDLIPSLPQRDIAAFPGGGAVASHQHPDHGT